MEFPVFPRISGPFERDPINPKNVNTEWYKDPLVSWLADKAWIITEKIDGTNIRICWDGYRVTLKGRTDNSQFNGGLLSYLQERFCSEEFESILEDIFGANPVMICGEGYGGNVQKAGHAYGSYGFRSFAGWSPSAGWWRRASFEGASTSLGLLSVPIIARMPLRDLIKDMQEGEEPVSRLLNDPSYAEGYVCRPPFDIYNQFGAPLMVKIKPDNVRRA